MELKSDMKGAPLLFDKKAVMVKPTNPPLGPDGPGNDLAYERHPGMI